MIELKTTLEKHQQEAVEKLGKLKVGALYMEQGTGKTRTAIQLAVDRLNAGKIDMVLWLCPCNVKTTIHNELIKHLGQPRREFVICGIETLSTSVKWNSLLLQLVLSKRVFLIVDESLLIKNHRALRTQNIMRLADHCTYKLILNGTPISKNEADLFAQWSLLDWRILGYKSFYEFARNHIRWSDLYPRKIDRILNADYLTQRIEPYTYQITKDSAYNLPGKKYRSYYFYLTEEQKQHYRDIGEYFLNLLTQMVPDEWHVYQMFNALTAVISGRRVNFKGKRYTTQPFFKNGLDNPRIVELLEVLPKDEQAIIFTEYHHEVEDILTALQGKGVEYSGKITSKRRNRNMQAFRAGRFSFLVTNKACGAFGLNLQFCHNLIFYSNNWDYATRIQAEDRVHRRGQTQPVTITDIVASGTIDENIVKCLMRKEDLLRFFKSNLSVEQARKLVKGEAL
jgi:SNF2 family DNA or RNA helicase